MFLLGKDIYENLNFSVISVLMNAGNPLADCLHFIIFTFSLAEIRLCRTDAISRKLRKSCRGGEILPCKKGRFFTFFRIVPTYIDIYITDMKKRDFTNATNCDIIYTEIMLLYNIRQKSRLKKLLNRRKKS